MYVFLIVILVLAAALEFFSLRSGAECVTPELSLSASRVEPGEAVEVTAVVQNHSRLPISYLCMKLSFSKSAQLPEGTRAVNDRQFQVVSNVYRLWGCQKKSRSMRFVDEKRGVHQVSCRELLRGDFLGLSASVDQYSLMREFLVYPCRLENNALLEALGTDFGEASAQRWLLRDPVLTLGVREYTGNEPMRTISWNQTARCGRLMVREFDFTRSMNCSVILCTNGMGNNEETLLDTCCSAVRTICEALAERGVEVKLFTNAAITGYGYARWRSCSAAQNKMNDVLDVLARVSASVCCPAEELAEACLSGAEDAMYFVLVVPHHGEEAEIMTLLLRERTGLMPMVIAADTLTEGQDDRAV